MRKTLSKSEIKELNASVEQQYGVHEFFKKNDRVDVIDDLSLVKDQQRIFFKKEGLIIPTLHTLLTRSFLKQVVVDRGAVKFVADGADVMRQGIVRLDTTINVNDVVVIVDETHKKPIAVGRALYSAQDILALPKGKVIKTLHHVGDDVWNYSAV